MKTYKFLLWLILLTSLVCLATEARAGKDPLSVSYTVLIDRNRYMPRHIAVEVISRAMARIPAHVSYRIKVSPRNSCSKLTTDNSVQLNCYKQVRAKQRGRVLFLSEPTIIGDVIYTEGRAQVGYSQATGVCNVTEKNQEGLSRVEHAIVACSHEAGHEAGAVHDNKTFYGDCPTVMHEAPLSKVPACPGMKFSPTSKTQIRWRLSRENRD